MWRPKSSGMKLVGSIGFMVMLPSAVFEALERLVYVDLATRDLFHELHAGRRRRGRRSVDAALAKECVETRSGGWLADTQVPLELLHVSARCQKDPEYASVLRPQRAQLQGLE